MTPRDYFELLSYVAVVDRELHESEVPLLRGFAERLQLSQEEAGKILAHLRTGARPTASMPEGAKDRSTLFRHMARIAVADHRLAPEEMDLLVRIGAALGQDRAAVYDTVDRAMQAAGGPPIAVEGGPPAAAVPDLASPAPSAGGKAPKKAEPKLELVPVDEAGEHAAAERRATQQARPLDPLARTDYAVLRDLGGNMKIVAVVLWAVPGAFSALGALAGLYLAASGSAPPAPTLIGAGVQGIQATVLATVAWNTWQAAGKFAQAGASRANHDPVRRVMAGLSHLHTVYRIQMILAVLVVLLFSVGSCLAFTTLRGLMR